MFNFFKKNQSKSEGLDADKPASLRQRLNKSRQKLGSGLSSLLLGKKEINDDLLEALETLLITADVGINTTDKILESVRKNASRNTLKDAENLYQFLKDELAKLLLEDNQLNTNINETFVILVVGVNGAGKTTLIGKMAKSFQNQGKSVMLAAGDTFRAAAVEQLRVWGQRNNTPVVAQTTGTDAASVIFDAYQSAQAKNIDILIADTAGRLHTQNNLMQELAKIKRVIAKQNENAPHETMLVIDGGSGQNVINQAKEFNKAVTLSGISITKLDGTAKGGILFAIADELNLPIRYIGVGEEINDLKAFQSKEFINALFD
ncbi:signal recognition particle-docking protein FtsY [Candidatus Ruthia endofausta]|uniref:Signal recognition particle receptor FtsY n=2 Tax=Gammaproteobacteria incertae sedis TaxID=118884 RepID=A0A6N0HMU5_9GAMM|nr:signal recognition particle-docking protein FtsY [Candidatus Ruthia endofausta]QKQ23665.1 signal recognition particle-docking protein FtsY [Candidatus Ruthia endofausta]